MLLFYSIKLDGVEVMNKLKIKLIALALAIILVIALCSCGADNGQANVVSAKSLVVEVDGKNITIEEAEGKTIDELLKDAKVELNNGDVLSLDTEAKLSDSMVVKILRQADVTIKDTIKDIKYTVVLTGATVADALSAADIKLADDHKVNYDLNKALEDGMEIVISIKEIAETTEPHTEEDDDNNSYNDNSSSNSNSGYTPPATKPATTKPVQTTKPAVTSAPAPKPDVPTTSGRTVVNVEIYEDCDGSGHGVKVITYSDGTQEEVPF